MDRQVRGDIHIVESKAVGNDAEQPFDDCADMGGCGDSIAVAPMRMAVMGIRLPALLVAHLGLAAPPYGLVDGVKQAAMGPRADAVIISLFPGAARNMGEGVCVVRADPCIRRVI